MVVTIASDATGKETMRLFEIARESMPDAKALAAEAGQHVAGDGGVIGLSGFLRIYPASFVPTWNERDRWKFAWGELAEGWHFLGGTAFGDQYALRAGSDEVFVLDAFTLVATRSWPNVAALVASEPAVFLDESADIIADVVGLLGAPPTERHVVFAPPPRISGEMQASGAMFLPAATAMVLNGDIALQALDASGKVVEGVETVVDDAGRPRIRLRTC